MSDQVKLAEAVLKTWRNVHYLSGYAAGGWCNHCSASINLTRDGLKFTKTRHDPDCVVRLAEKIVKGK